VGGRVEGGWPRPWVVDERGRRGGVGSCEEENTARRDVSHPVLRSKSDAQYMYVQDQIVVHTARM
jgi:hypothetical protein